MGGRGSASSGGGAGASSSDVRATDKMFTALGTNNSKKGSGSSKNARSKTGKSGGSIALNPANIIKGVAKQVQSAANTLGI